MDNLANIPKCGPKTIAKLNRLGIEKPIDLLYHFPHRYIDFSHCTAISDVKDNTAATITGQLINFQNVFTRRGKSLQKAIVEDDTGQITLIWFNQRYLSSNFKVGETYSFAGTISIFQNKKTIIAPVSGQHNTGKIIPIYPETTGLTSSWFRQIIPNNIENILPDIADSLPSSILKNHQLLPLKLALKQIHEPTDFSLLKQATLRLGLNEILSLQSAAYINKLDWTSKTAHQIFKATPKINKQMEGFIASLPFTLTPAQFSAWKDINADLLSTRPSNRLLQGDVGSGKTMVAILSCLLAHLNKSTSLVVAPTEILAQQHLATFKKYLKIPIYLLTSKSKIDLKKLTPGSIIISTHAAIYQKSSLSHQVGLLIVDEQHKFGVAQRTFLVNSLHPPHCLTMTATPIPRTVSLTIMGNLDLSIIDQPPINRKPIKTFLVPSQKYSDCYKWLENHILTTHEQAFIVCPFIEISESMSSVKSAVQLYEELKLKVFPHLKIALLHGKITQNARVDTLNDFSQNKINILVTTPIIEVGIDFPNATCIIIQSADRFGLAQLHQLRGRVGRSDLQSYCYLFSESDNEKSHHRLKMLQTTNDGQKISEYDLKTRGPGEAFSVIQHGFPSLKIADFSDYTLINLGQKIITEIQSTDPKFNFESLIHRSTLIHTATN